MHRHISEICHKALVLFKPRLEFVDLPAHYLIHKGCDPVELVYFLNDGISSLVIEDSSGHAAEIGLLGKEGVAGASGALALGRDVVTEIVQAAGNGYRIRADKLR